MKDADRISPGVHALLSRDPLWSEVSPASGGQRSGAIEPVIDWHLLSVEEVAVRLRSASDRGLAAAEAASRLTALGPNVVHSRVRRSPIRIFLGQFKDVMVLVLAGAAVLAGLIGEPQDSVAIAAILILNAALGFIQEFRAERALEALRALATTWVRVRRDRAAVRIPGTDLVPGDLVLLEAGTLVPADLRLTEAAHLRVEEATLTGESLAVEKTSARMTDPALPLGDRRNMAYRGTVVSHGRGTGLVVATGMSTELGRIARMLAEAPLTRTPLQRRLTRLGQRLAAGALAISLLVLALGLLRGEAPLPMLLTAVSLAVAAIPESLPAVVTVVLALGARRLARRHALVRQLPAVETLGSVTCICADKTGTLSLNRMRAEAFAVGDATAMPPGPDRPEPWPTLLAVLALNSDVEAGLSGDPIGDPTEVALYRAALGAGIDPVRLALERPRLAELPFDGTRGRMTTLHRAAAGIAAYTKGAPEAVVAACTSRWGPGGVETLHPAAILQQAERLASAGLRVLGVSCRTFDKLPAPLTPATVEAGQSFLGLIGLLDPPRPEAAAAITECDAAGIRVVMITGDHPLTARHLARRLGLPHAEGELLTGAELGRLSGEELERRVQHVGVYARVAADQKLAIVRALQARGECVGMTGDGVNDAPALRLADIGIAMGRSGTDVAREAAPMVLLDDNFATIVAAVKEGRRIYDNLRKFVRYAVTCNAAEVWTLLLAPLIALPIPLLPIHLLWINLVTDGLPGIALAAESAEPDVMRRPPRPPAESIFARGLWQHIVWVGLLMAGATLATEAWFWLRGSAHWQTMTFTVLALSQMGHVLAIRSERESLLRIGLRSNLPLLGAVTLTVLLQLGTIYLPGAGSIFKTEPLTGAELAICLGLSSVVFLGVEAEKWLIRRGYLYRAAVEGPAGRRVS